MGKLQIGGVHSVWISKCRVLRSSFIAQWGDLYLLPWFPLWGGLHHVRVMGVGSLFHMLCHVLSTLLMMSYDSSHITCCAGH
jgi:hypothetical protein